MPTEPGTEQASFPRVAVNVRAGITLWPPCPYPVAFLWIGNDIHDCYPCGITYKRIKWLPIWVPFNCRWDHSLEAQAKCTEILFKLGERLLAKSEGR